MTSSVEHIHNLDRHLVNEGEEYRSMALWVPSERVTVHRIDVPTAPQRKWSELIPWILEDRLLQPVEDMHFVIGAITGEDDKKQVDVTAVSKQDMREWLRIAENASVNATALVPDYLALPSEEGRISMVWREGLFLVRDASGQGFCAAPELAGYLVGRLAAASEIAPRLSVSVPDENLVPESLRDNADINAADIDWQLSELPLSANLLTCEFESTANKVSSASWLLTGALLLLVAVLSFGYLQISNYLLQDRVTLLENQAVKGFGKVFPGKNSNPDKIRVTGEKLLSGLFKQRQSLDAPAMQGLFSAEKFMTNCGCDLEILSANESEVDFEVQNLNKSKVARLNVPGYKVITETTEDITNINLRRVSKP